ncbi:MAG: dihydroneopterin aldolase [Zoogloeaceae bacterium]|jgi:dihydroneopterin aldolase|nr:dihydroneopterin aldolase [Zoogloeaceae bacterium]
MDTIFIEALRIETWIGVYPREKAMPQTVAFDLEIGYAPPPAGAGTDDIRATVDYAAVVDRLRAELTGRRFNLLERLAEYVASLILTEFTARRVRVSVAKPGILRGVGRVGVTIERERDDPGT